MENLQQLVFQHQRLTQHKDAELAQCQKELKEAVARELTLKSEIKELRNQLAIEQGNVQALNKVSTQLKSTNKQLQVAMRDSKMEYDRKEEERRKCTREMTTKFDKLYKEMMKMKKNNGDNNNEDEQKHSPKEDDHQQQQQQQQQIGEYIGWEVDVRKKMVAAMCENCIATCKQEYGDEILHYLNGWYLGCGGEEGNNNNNNNKEDEEGDNGDDVVVDDDDYDDANKHQPAEDLMQQE